MKLTESPTSSETAKSLGAFYTDIQVADFLVWWAVRSAFDTVLDPSFGGGVFVRSASNRLLSLGGKPEEQIFGVEVDSKVHSLISEKLQQEFSILPHNLQNRDFFDLEPLPVNKVNAVVGNPPFIRYQRFTSEVRSRALSQAADCGVRLTQLSSSWAPFLIHSSAMLKSAGRLAMVVPMEIAHASYALPVLKFLQQSFSRCTFLTFRKKLFTTLSEDTLLLLAEQRDGTFQGFFHRDVEHAGLLSKLQTQDNYRIAGSRRLQANRLTNGSERLIEYLLPRKTRQLYEQLKELNLVSRLGDVVDVGIGYVTGANEFFHLSQEDVEKWNIPSEFLKPAVRRSRALSGLRFTKADWNAAAKIGNAGFLLSIPKAAALPMTVQEYLEIGRRTNVPDAYKCRARSPWYTVPHVYEPDAFLTYMSGHSPRLVANEAGAVAPNSLHVLRIHPHVSVNRRAIAALWQTSLTLLSVEVQGHSLGGGMLKVEPSEAENCVIAGTTMKNRELSELSSQLDLIMRTGDHKSATKLADEVILQDHLGLSRTDCVLLHEAAETLRNRRYSRSTQ